MLSTVPFKRLAKSVGGTPLAGTPVDGTPPAGTPAGSAGLQRAHLRQYLLDL
jgi:hypothetical protein